MSAITVRRTLKYTPGGWWETAGVSLCDSGLRRWFTFPRAPRPTEVTFVQSALRPPANDDHYEHYQLMLLWTAAEGGRCQLYARSPVSEALYMVYGSLKLTDWFRHNLAVGRPYVWLEYTES